MDYFCVKHCKMKILDPFRFATMVMKSSTICTVIFATSLILTKCKLYTTYVFYWIVSFKLLIKFEFRFKNVSPAPPEDFPSEIIAGKLYLGGYKSAKSFEVL